MSATACQLPGAQEIQCSVVDSFDDSLTLNLLVLESFNDSLTVQWFVDIQSTRWHLLHLLTISSRECKRVPCRRQMSETKCQWQFVSEMHGAQSHSALCSFCAATLCMNAKKGWVEQQRECWNSAKSKNHPLNMTPEVRLWCKLDTSRVQVKPDCLVIWLASQPPVTPSPAFWSTGLLSKAANSFFESSALSLALFFQVLLWPVPDDFCPVVFAALVLLPWGCWCTKLAFDGGFLANAWWCLVRLTRENANKSGVNGASLFARLTLTDGKFWVRHMVDLCWCCVKPHLSSNFLYMI